MSTRRLFNNSFFTIAAKFTNAFVQFISLPILLKVFGKSDYGLIVIAMSLNTFIYILQIGLPMGFPKFIAEWLAKGERKQMHAAIQTVSSFYLAIALISFLILLSIAFFGTNLFKINLDQFNTLQTLLIITAITSLLAIPATVLNELLTGAQELGFIAILEMIRNVFFAGLVAFVYLHPEALSIVVFYILQCILMFLTIPLKLKRWMKYGSMTDLLPGWNFSAVLPVLKYCLSLMVFSIFVLLESRVQPIILGIRIPSNAGEALSNFQILDYMRTFLMMIGASFMVTLIPHISGAMATGNQQIYDKTIKQGTKYIWCVGALIGFGLIMLSKEVLSIYVGPENIVLQTWMIILIGATLYNLYATCISAAILSSGRLVPMMFATASGFLVAVLFNWFFVPIYGVGGVAFAVAAYNLVNLLVTHFWYLPRYFKIEPMRQILFVMLPPVFAGIIMCITGQHIIGLLGSNNDYINIAIGIVCGTLIYTSIIMLIYIRPKEFRELLSRILNPQENSR